MTQILPTQNKKHGFWGTCSGFIKKEQTKAAWEIAFVSIRKIAGFTPLETLALLDSCWGRHIAEEFAEEISADCFKNAFMYKITKDRLYRDYNCYIDPTAYKTNKKSFRYENFIKDLAKLSKTYGITIKSIGGISVHAINDMKDFNGYTMDLESGNILPIWQNKHHT